MKKKALFLSLSSVVLLSLAACGPAESNSDSGAMQWIRLLAK